MAQPQIYPIKIYRGDDYNWQFKLWLDAQKTQPVDLTDVAVKAEIRDQSQGRTIIPLGCVVTLPNIIDMNLLGSDSSNVPRPTAYWDLRLTYLNGTKRTILVGSVTVIPDITDSTPPPPIPTP
jgi:hypothetical protein